MKDSSVVKIKACDYLDICNNANEIFNAIKDKTRDNFIENKNSDLYLKKSTNNNKLVLVGNHKDNSDLKLVANNHNHRLNLDSIGLNSNNLFLANNYNDSSNLNFLTNNLNLNLDSIGLNNDIIYIYRPLAIYKDRTNCKAILFRKDDEYIVSFFGTDFKNLKDLGTNVSMVAGNNPKQFKSAEKFVKKVMEKYSIPKEKLTAIGNSEGGAEAIYIKATFGIKDVYTFNGYVPKLVQYSNPNLEDNRIYNFRTPEDIVSKAGYSIGEDFIVDFQLKDGKKLKPGILKYIDYHRIDNMGDCNEASSLEEFKKGRPDWKNKYGIGILKSYEVEDIPQDLYEIFDDVINDRLRNRAVVNAYRPNSKSGCVGTYLVNAYTRSDGSKVAAYFRTCGAAHNS